MSDKVIRAECAAITVQQISAAYVILYNHPQGIDAGVEALHLLGVHRDIIEAARENIGRVIRALSKHMLERLDNIGTPMP